MANGNNQGGPRGGVPAAAQSRIHHSIQSGAAATSFFDHSGFLLMDEMGFEPVGAVIGLSVMHIGRPQIAGLRQAVELDQFSNAISMGLVTSLRRLQEEAHALGADGVILSSLVSERPFDAEEHEYSIRGTAVRFSPRPGALRAASGAPFVSVLNGRQLYQMLKRGYTPVTCGYGVCVYHVPHRTVRQSITQTFQNTEIPQFTDAWYTAREIALSRVQAEMESHGAHVIINLDVEERVEAFGEHTAEFRAFGSGWAKRPDIAGLVPDVDFSPYGLVEHGVYPTTSYRQP